MKSSRFSLQRSSIHSNQETNANNSKLKALNTRWDTLEAQDYRYTTKKRVFLEENLNEIEVKAIKCSEEAEKAIKNIENQIFSINDEFLQEKKAGFFNNEKLSAVAFGLQENFIEEITENNEKMNRRNDELTEEFTEKYRDLHEKIKENFLRKDGESERNYKEITIFSENCWEKLEGAKKGREEGKTMIEMKLGEEIQGVFDTLELEKKTREKTEGMMMNMIEKMSEDFMKEIQVFFRKNEFLFDFFDTFFKGKNRKISIFSEIFSKKITRFFSIFF